MDKNYNSGLDFKKSAKRYLLVLLCSLPILILVGIALEGKVNKAVRIFINVLIIATVFVVEELIYSKRKNKKKEEKPKQDVFK